MIKQSVWLRYGSFGIVWEGMNIGVCRSGAAGVASVSRVSTENIDEQTLKENRNSLDIKAVFSTCKMRNSKSEDNLFWKRHLHARCVAQLKGDKQRNSFWNTLMYKMHVPVVDRTNKRYICRYASDAILGKFGSIPADIENISLEGDDENDEIDILNFTQDKHEHWCLKYQDWRKHADYKEIAIWMAELSESGFDLGPLSKCSLRQQAAIAQYVSQMLRYGYKVVFAKEVFNAMITIYTTKIWGYTLEECLPEYISPEDYDRDNPDNRSPLTFNDRYREHREWIAERLERLIESEGGDYSIISTYCRFQQRDSSWCETSRMLKGFYLEQRADLDVDKFYFLIGGNTGSRANPKEWGFGAESFIEQFHTKYPTNSPEYISYFKTIAIHQGFIAVALNYIDGILGLDRKSGMFTVYRVSNRHHIPGQSQGILESTSLERPASFLADENSTSMRFTLPFSSVKFIYFLSKEMCDHGKLSAEEREMICDLSSAQVFDCTVIDLQSSLEIVVVNKNVTGEIGVNINGIRAYLVRPYLIDLKPNIKAVFLYDRYHFWEDHVSVKLNGREHKGYTINPLIVQIAEKAAMGNFSQEDIGKIFVQS
ncbi:MAG: hypothetical protein K2L13_02455 [Opitutales bacterium]|nr:hypothetical protein [Opitutales bacterium]